MKTAIDWSAKPAPWCYIGVAWAIEVRRICGAKAAAAQLPDQQSMDLLGRRLRAKLTTRELAKRADCAETTISNLEHGRSTASPEMWRRIDAALDAKLGLAEPTPLPPNAFGPQAKPREDHHAPPQSPAPPPLPEAAAPLPAAAAEPLPAQQEWVRG